MWRSTPCWLYPTCHAIPSVARQDSVLLYLCMVPQTSILCVQNSQHHSVKHPPVEVVWVEAAGWMDGLYLSHVLTNTHKGVRPRASCATLDADFWLRSWMVTPSPCKQYDLGQWGWEPRSCPKLVVPRSDNSTLSKLAPILTTTPAKLGEPSYI